MNIIYDANLIVLYNIYTIYIYLCMEVKKSCMKPYISKKSDLLTDFSVDCLIALRQAVELILRSSQFFTTHEWQQYVGN